MSESIEPALYPFDTVMKLRALVWREQGYVLGYLGAFPEALAALDRADEYLTACSVADYDQARSTMYRALMYRELERYTEALTLLRDARPVFLMYEDRKRVAAVDTTEAIVLMGLRKFSEALAITLRVSADADLDEQSRASATHNAAMCYRELSRFVEAKRLFAHAVITFEKLGLPARRAVSRWGIARVLLDEGRFEDALVLLNEVRKDFEEFGMSEDLATASLHAADALLVLRRPEQVADLCRSAIRYFERAGLAYSQPAMTALGYLREASEQGTLDAVKIERVRNYIKILPKQPNLLFAFSA